MLTQAPSLAGPVSAEEASGLACAPTVPIAPWRARLQMIRSQHDFMFRARREHGEVFRVDGWIKDGVTVTSHPDHVRSLLTAKPELVPSTTAESPLRPIVGPASVLTANGPRHLRQRKLLLPPFHGEAIGRYSELIQEATDRELDSWSAGTELTLAPRMQAITLDVIMAGIFGARGRPPRRSTAGRLRNEIRLLMSLSTQWWAQIAEFENSGRDKPIGLTKLGLMGIDRWLYRMIVERRRVDDLDDRTDVMSLLMRATTDDGEHLTDRELRDELLTLVLAGHETTANQLAWAWERLVRTPAAHDALRHAVRSDVDADAQVEATLIEAMRSRPVIPAIGRRPTAAWRLGDFGVPAGSAVSVSILLLHHREDLYPDAAAFRPDRWTDRKPGTYEWLPFGGGTRRCLGATLAMTEMRIVLATMARRLDLTATDPAPERPKHRNVTMIPGRGARVRVQRVSR